MTGQRRDADSETVCRNCGAALTGPFCAQCGQRVVPPHPTTKELAGDAYNELVGWDGRFARTIRLLVARPGELTRAVIEGRRAQFVGSVRLYLMCSVLYFVVQAGAPLPDVNASFDIGFGIGIGEAPSPGEAAFAKSITQGRASLTEAERALVEREIESQPWLFRGMFRAMAEDYRGLTRRASETIPRVLFVLIPVLAAVLALFYRRRHYPEHLYFAVHFGAFVFIVLTVEALALYTRSLVAAGVVQIVGTGIIVIYGVVAQRRVYGGSWLATGAKALGVSLIYGALWSSAVLAVTLWVST
jgi:hypothetical protein